MTAAAHELRKRERQAADLARKEAQAQARKTK